MDIRLDEFFVELRRFTYDQPFLFRVLYFLQIGQEAYWKSPELTFLICTSVAGHIILIFRSCSRPGPSQPNIQVY